MSRLWLFLFLFILLQPLLPQVMAAPQNAVVLTIEEAVELAVSQSLVLQRSSIDLNQAAYSANNLWSEIFPGFSLSARMNLLPSTNLFTGDGFSYSTNNLSYSITLGASLSLNPSIRSSMDRISLAYSAQLLSWENARNQLEIQVIKSFLSLANRQENIKHLQDRLETALHKLEQDRIARQNGLLSELAWLNSQLSVQTARYNLSTAAGAYQNALGEFLAQLGMDPSIDLILDGTMEIGPLSLNAESLIFEHLPRRPDIVAQRQTIERLELNRNITTLSSRSPSLSLSTTWQGGSLTGRDGGGLGAPFVDSISGNITLSVPIDSWIPGTRQNQNVRAVSAEVEKARLDLQNTETRAKNQIRSLVSNLENTWESIEIARLRLDIAQRTVEATEIGFRNGTAGYQELEDRRNDLSDARQRLLQGELTYQNMLLDLAAALNINWRTLAANWEAF